MAPSLTTLPHPRRSAGRRPKAGPADIDTRAAILTAGRKAFALHGINGTSVREVAAAARVNNAMIYYHFKHKDDLYRAVLADSFSALTAIWEDPFYRSSATVRKKIERYLDRFIRFQQGNEELRRIMAMEFAAGGGNIAWVCEKFFADNFSRLVSLFREGMRRGEIRKCDPAMVVASLIGVVVHNFIMQQMAEHVHGRKMDLSPKKFGTFVTGLFFEGLGPRTQYDRRKPRNGVRP